METRVFKALKQLGKSKGVKDIGKLKRGERTALIKELRSSNKSFRYGSKDMEKWVGRKLKGQRFGKEIASMPTSKGKEVAQVALNKAVSGKSAKSVAALKARAAAGKGSKSNPYTAKAKADASYNKARKGKISKKFKGKWTTDASGKSVFTRATKTDRSQQWSTKRQIKKNTKNQAAISQEAAGNRAYAKSEKTKDMGPKKDRSKLQDNEYWGKFKDWASKKDVQTGAAAGVGTALLGSALLGD